MYNNDVTYHDKWKTPENEAALRKLEKRFFDRSECCPDCPLSWAVEVLELFESLDRTVGIRHNEGTMRGYYVQGSPLKWFVTNPWLSAFKTFKYHFFSDKSKYYTEKGLVHKLKETVGAFWHSISYGFRASKVVYVNRLLNKWSGASLRLSQVKEKFGTLRVYLGSPAIYSDFIDAEVRKCEIKLAAKGAYFPIESLWDWGVSYNIENEYNPDSIEVKVTENEGKRTVNIHKTLYRAQMKELGLNLAEIAEKAKAYKEKNEENV